VLFYQNIHFIMIYSSGLLISNPAAVRRVGCEAMFAPAIADSFGSAPVAISVHIQVPSLPSLFHLP